MICPAGHRVIDSTGEHYTLLEVGPGLYAYAVGACEELDLDMLNARSIPADADNRGKVENP